MTKLMATDTLVVGEGSAGQTAALTAARASWRITAAALCSIACASITACASSIPYNPRNLDTAKITQVARICQTTMGLQPSEPQFDNLWPGDPDQGLSTNRYRGCIASLSDSLHGQDGADVNTSIAETLRRQRRACAEIGLEPSNDAFASCVRGLQNALSAKDMNANYEN